MPNGQEDKKKTMNAHCANKQHCARLENARSLQEITNQGKHLKTDIAINSKLYKRVHQRSVMVFRLNSLTGKTNYAEKTLTMLNTHLTLFRTKYVLSTMGVIKESISKFLIGNRFHVKLRIFSPYSNRMFQSLSVFRTSFNHLAFLNKFEMPLHCLQ